MSPHPLNILCPTITLKSLSHALCPLEPRQPWTGPKVIPRPELPEGEAIGFSPDGPSTVMTRRKECTDGEVSL